MKRVQMDLDWPWSDGGRRIAAIRYTPRRDASGSVDGFYVFAQDVTDLRDAPPCWQPVPIRWRTRWRSGPSNATGCGRPLRT